MPLPISRTHFIAVFVTGHRKLLLGLGAGFVLVVLPSLYFLLFPPHGKEEELSPAPGLARILENGVLRVATRNSPTTWFLGAAGESGFEYELALAFANHLGVELEVVPVKRFDEILPMVERAEVDLAAAGITVTDERKERIRFGPVYQQVREQVVYRRGGFRPLSLADLPGRSIEVIAGSAHAQSLRGLTVAFPELAWTEVSGVDSEDLLRKVWAGEIDLTVADSNDLLINRRFYPELAVAFDISADRDFAWAFPPGEDTELIDVTTEFFNLIRRDGTFTEIYERSYGQIRHTAMVDTPTFLQHVAERLRPLRHFFETAVREHELDWRLLAAIGYQESHWNPQAISPTGVRGIMMLTEATAGQLGLTNRLDPWQSIRGGAEYFLWVKARIPERIPEPDRTWFALATYNVGYGHLEDARIITQQLGDDPDKWSDVMKHLPKLSQSLWYEKTRYGYARGYEPVRYVQNIRGYHDLLVRLTEREGEDIASERVTGEPDKDELPITDSPPYDILPPGL